MDELHIILYYSDMNRFLKSRKHLGSMDMVLVFHRYFGVKIFSRVFEILLVKALVLSRDLVWRVSGPNSYGRHSAPELKR